MSVPIATLMCHAPIVVPAVGGDRAPECAATTAAMRAVAARIVARRPAVLVVLSPHTPRARDAWGILEADVVRGDLAAFRAPREQVRLPGAPVARSRLRAAAAGAGARVARLPDQPLDHGAMVPLWFLVEAGWRGPTVVVALPGDESGAEAFGRALREAAGDEPWAILASGDLSHRLQPGAPAGFHPEARAFDAAFVGRLRAGDLRGASQVAPSLREIAAEDVVTSTAAAAAAVAHRGERCEVLAYEGPFGVGYCEAVLFEEVG
jgi:aromatic ring-opening dioxygenase LigB subunit